MSTDKIKLANTNYNYGNDKEAERLYQEVLDEDQNNHDALFGLCLVEFSRKNYDNALNYVDKAINIVPSINFYLFKGNIHLDKGEIDKAIDCYQLIIRQYPDIPDVNCNLGYAYRKNNEIEKALSFYEKTVQLNPNHVTAHVYLGNLLFDIDPDKEKAIKSYSKALEIDPAKTDLIIDRNDVRYFIWRHNKAKNARIKFLIVYFYENDFNKNIYNDFLEKLKNQIYKSYTVIIANDDNNLIKNFYANDCSHICFIEQGDLLSEDALLSLAEIIKKNNSIELLYSDEDVINSAGEHINPYFKPEFSPLLLLSHNYMNAFLCLKLNDTNINEINRINKINQKSLYELVLNLTKQKINIKRIPDVLYHREFENFKKLENTSTSDIISNALKKDNIKAEFLDSNVKGLNIIKFLPENKSKVSIIIPFKDKVSFLKKCIESIESRTSYDNYEIIPVDNRSQELETFNYLNTLNHRILKADIDFNYSKINNMAVKIANGDYIIFLNNDVEITTPDWIETMLGLAQLPQTGLVGVKLFFPNNTIQAAGLNKTKNNGFSFINRLHDVNDAGYKNLNNLAHECTLFMTACAMISKDKYWQVGGFDENLEVNYGDFELCFKLLKAGYYNVYNPHSPIVHYEGISRSGKFNEKIPQEKIYYFSKISYLSNLDDQFYNPNFSLHDSFKIKIT